MYLISIDQGENLFWLGRYVERVCMTLHHLDDLYDVLLDSDNGAYAAFCEKLNIPNIYENDIDFIAKYQFAKDNPDSLYSNLSRAYDNGLVLRNTISSTTLSYIQMALDLLSEGQKGGACSLINQQLIDYLLAFWGCLDEKVYANNERNLIKAGRYLERLDMELRLGAGWKEVEVTLSKLSHRLKGAEIAYNVDKLARLKEIAKAAPADDASRRAALELADGLMDQPRN
jgi:uncharacterized alpha-E superfamily protein